MITLRVCFFIFVGSIYSSELCSSTSEARVAGDDFFQAVSQGDVVQVKKLLKKGIDLYEEDGLCNTALHRAAKQGRKDLAVLLLDAAEEFERKKENKVSVKFINKKNIHGMTALHEAVYGNHAAVAELLISRGARKIDHAQYNPLFDGPVCYGRPLHVAAQGGSVSSARLLLAAGADVHFRDSRGRTALHYAAEQGNSELYELLCEHEASEYEEDSEGVIPFHCAVLQGRTNLVSSILKRRSTMIQRTTSKKKQTPLHCAIKQGHRSTVAVLLNEEKGLLNVLDSEKNTPIHLASEVKDPVLFKMLIEKGACINVPSDYRIDWGALRRLSASIKDMVNSIEVTSDDALRWRALLSAVKSNDDEATHLILEKKSLKGLLLDGDEQDRILNLLNNAIRTKNKAVIEYLLESSISLIKKDQRDKSALTYARETYDETILDLILSKAARIKPTVQSIFDNGFDQRAQFFVELQDEFLTALEDRKCTPALIDLFIKAGANVNADRNLSSEGTCPLVSVALTGNVEVARLLIKRKALVNKIFYKADLRGVFSQVTLLQLQGCA